MEIIHSEYIKVTSPVEAISQMNSTENGIFVAGGTDVYVNKQQGNLCADVYIDISGIELLKSIKMENGIVEIGALVTLEQLIISPIIQEHFPVLREAALAVATPVIRKTATLGGNILCENRCSFYNQSEWWREAVGYCLKCNGDICIATGGKKNCFSKFVSDTAPVMIACGGNANLMDENGIRLVSLENLYTGDGVNSLAMNRKTLLLSIQIPLGIRKMAFKKLRPRKTLDFTSLTTVVCVDQEQNLSIVIGGVDPKPVVILGNLNTDDLSTLVNTACKKPRVVENDYYSRPYRKDMIKVFLEQSIKELGI